MSAAPLVEAGPLAAGGAPVSAAPLGAAGVVAGPLAAGGAPISAAPLTAGFAAGLLAVVVFGALFWAARSTGISLKNKSHVTESSMR